MLLLPASKKTKTLFPTPAHIYTVSKRPPPFILNNCEKNETILVIFDVENPKEINFSSENYKLAQLA